jgi:hypothetical protein
MMMWTLNNDYLSVLQATSPLRAHPERMPEMKDVTHTLDPIISQSGRPLTTPAKKAKWHLGKKSKVAFG